MRKAVHGVLTATLVIGGSSSASAWDRWSPGSAAAVRALSGLAVGTMIGATARPVYPPPPVYVERDEACFVEMVWGERRGHVTFGAVEQSDGVPHAAIERFEPVPYRFRPGQHADRRHRNEPIELACRGAGPRHRATATEEAFSRRGRAAEACAALAQRSGTGGSGDQAHRRRL